MKNIQLKERTAADIDTQVAKILRNLGNPEPPLDLRLVRELLKLDRSYYDVADDGLLRETISRLKVGGLQILKRPTILMDVVKSLSLKALYLPDQKRILLDSALPELKHRWNEAHEIGHDIIPWHAGMMMGDTEQTLIPVCHAQMEAEANYAAAQLLFLSDRFVTEARDFEPTLNSVLSLKKVFGNTITTTLWRYVEQVRPDVPIVGLVTDHPQVSLRKADFDPLNPCKYVIQSPGFSYRFSRVTETGLFQHVCSYCGAKRRGPLGEAEISLNDDVGDGHVFKFETFFNGYDALTLAVYVRPHNSSVTVGL